jgi:hypothetical protein
VPFLFFSKMNDKQQQAFPGKLETGFNRRGMSLQDYFAGLAMQAMIISGRHSPAFGSASKMLAIEAYGVADAMLAEREKLNQVEDGKSGK